VIKIRYKQPDIQTDDSAMKNLGCLWKQLFAIKTVNNCCKISKVHLIIWLHFIS